MRLAAVLADVALERRIAERKMTELHRQDDLLRDEGGTKARAETEEEHLPALVASKRLHGRVVDHLRRLAQGILEVEADPTGAEIDGVGHHAAGTNDGRDADRDDVERPVARRLLDPGEKLLWSQVRSRLEPAPFSTASTSSPAPCSRRLSSRRLSGASSASSTRPRRSSPRAAS